MFCFTGFCSILFAELLDATVSQGCWVVMNVTFELLVVYYWQTVKQIKNLFKGSEVEVLRDGLHERALRIQELEVTVERLEAERPDSVNLQAAIESDKVMFSHAL